MLTGALGRPAAPAGRRRLDTADAVLAGALLVQLLPLLLLDRFVTVDGPAHLAGAAVLAGYDDPARQLLRELYVVDLGPVPNLLTAGLLAALLPLTGPDVAERVLLAGYVLLLVLGLRFALRAVDPRAGWLAVAAFPFVGSYLLHYGFYNFCLALGLFLFAVGVALRRRHGWSPAATVWLAGLLLLTWSAHLLPLLVAGLLVAVLSVARAGSARRHGASAREASGHLIGPALAGLPVLALTVVFLASSAAERGQPVRRPLLELLTGLVTLGRPLVVYDVLEYLPATVVALTLVAVAVLAGRAHRPVTPERLALAVTGLFVTLAYFASPDRYGPEFGFLNDRWSYFPPLFLLLWSAGPPPGPRARRAVVVALLGSALALTALRAPTQVQYQRAVEELVSVADDVPRGSTILQLRLWRVPVVGQARNPFRDPLRHAPGRLAVLRDGVDVGHYQAVLGYFPTRFRSTTDPRRLVDPTLQGLAAVPPDVDLTAAGTAVDVVLVVGRPQASAAVLQDPTTRRVLSELRDGYRQVAVSERSGLAEVWVRR